MKGFVPARDASAGARFQSGRCSDPATNAHTAADGTRFWRAGALMVQRVQSEDAQGSAEGRDIDKPLDLALEGPRYPRQVDLGN